MMIFVKLAQDFIHCAPNLIHGNFSLFAGFDEAAKKLLSINSFSRSVTFDYSQFGAFDLFIGGEARATIEALAPAPDRRAVF